jgi:hypothetical protein
MFKAREMNALDLLLALGSDRNAWLSRADRLFHEHGAKRALIQKGRAIGTDLITGARHTGRRSRGLGLLSPHLVCTPARIGVGFVVEHLAARLNSALLVSPDGGQHHPQPWEKPAKNIVEHESLDVQPSTHPTHRALR